LATVLFFGDDDLVGDLPFELVTVGGGRLGASETASYSDAADAEAGSSVKGGVFASSSGTATIRSLIDMTALPPALPLLRVLLRVEKLSSSPIAGVLCTFCFLGDPRVRLLDTGDVAIGGCCPLHAEHGAVLWAVWEVQMDRSSQREY
jgi:hypothetical protein